MKGSVALLSSMLGVVGSAVGLVATFTGFPEVINALFSTVSVAQVPENFRGAAGGAQMFIIGAFVLSLVLAFFLAFYIAVAEVFVVIAKGGELAFGVERPWAYRVALLVTLSFLLVNINFLLSFLIDWWMLFITVVPSLLIIWRVARRVSAHDIVARKNGVSA